MIDLKAFEGYLKMKGVKCQINADKCGGDEYIIVFGSNHSTAIIYTTLNNYILETGLNMYINPRYEEIENCLKEEEII